MIKKYILFDLDGTLSNPEEGITKSIQYSLRHMGIEVDDLNSLCKYIGPPLMEGFKEFQGFDEERAQKAVLKYREYFSVTGLYENFVYQGIKELLVDLVTEGKKLIVATSKPEIYAKLILEYFELYQLFQDICGASIDGSRSKKGDVISYALEKNNITDLEEVIMVGDRLHDVNGAKENGIDSIGVLYGFGSREELEAAGAGNIAKDINELRELLLVTL